MSVLVTLCRSTDSTKSISRKSEGMVASAPARFFFVVDEVARVYDGGGFDGPAQKRDGFHAQGKMEESYSTCTSTLTWTRTSWCA